MRSVNPDNQYKVRIQRDGKYRYASTQPRTVDEKTGEIRFKRVHWGVVDENNKFIPNTFYKYTPIEERKKLIFPPDWDLSEIKKLSGERTQGRQTIETHDENRLYGDVWLMEKIAESIGLKEDIIEVFEGNIEMANDILSIAMFLIGGKGTLNHMEAWQRITKTPSDYLPSPAITKLTQCITNQNRTDLFRLRIERINEDELCAVDSTSRSTYGNTLADIRWGKNKERIPLPQTTEVVVYTLSSHTPVYYRTFPGNMPDSRSFNTIIKEMKSVGTKKIVIITDRGYESVFNREMLIDMKQPMIMGAKTSQKIVSDRIPQYSPESDAPEGMKYSVKDRVFYQQFNLEYQIEGKRGNIKKASNLKLNLYYSPIRKAHEQAMLIQQRYEQEEMLSALQEEKTPIEDEETLRNECNFFTLHVNKNTHILDSYEFNKPKYLRSSKSSGFFANITQGLELTPIEANNHYHLRDEQEKNFTRMKSNLRFDRVRVWSEMGKDGREFILFIADILISQIAFILKTKLSDKFTSVDAILDEMRPIRCIEHPNTKPFITPFVGKQLDICKAFEFDVPEGCSPEYAVRKTNKGKRGRPLSRKSVIDDN